MAGELIKVTRANGVATIRLARDKALNALNRQLMSELAAALRDGEADPEVRCHLIVGSERAFSAGVDINEMADSTPIDFYTSSYFDDWNALRDARKPIVAGVSGYCLGGGCELAMSCDLIVASETATFGQPEINLGVIPGAGGTQRLTRAIGKAKTMDMVLSGRMLDAAEAERAGLVARVAAADAWLEESRRLAESIATKSSVALTAAKEAVSRSFDAPLDVGLDYERRLFYMLFSSQDQKEGMRAFAEKRPAEFVGR